MNTLLTNVSEPAIEYAPLPAVGDHTPASAGAHEFAPVAGANVGIWEMPPGIAQFDDEEELFVVISGSATLTFVRSGETLEIGPGAVVRLFDGEQTHWVVHETIRKVYVSV